MPRTYVTGFGPFAGVAENPSAALAATCGLPHDILEVSYEAADLFVKSFDPLAYDSLLLLGVATGRSQVNVELEAKNLRSGLDVRGVSQDGLIEVDGPQSLKSTLWTQELVEFLKIEYPQEVALSLDAGVYLCNYLYYRALRTLAMPRIGFLHVAMPDQIPLARQQEILSEILGELKG